MRYATLVTGAKCPHCPQMIEFRNFEASEAEAANAFVAARLDAHIRVKHPTPA